MKLHVSIQILSILTFSSLQRCYHYRLIKHSLPNLPLLESNRLPEDGNSGFIELVGRAGHRKQTMDQFRVLRYAHIVAET